LATNPTDPFTAIFQTISDLFSGATSGNAVPAGEFEWKPWENDGRIRPAREWGNPPPGSLRSGLRQDTSPRLRIPEPGDEIVNAARESWRNTPAASGNLVTGNTRKVPAKQGVWTATDPTWASLNNWQKAAVMSLMEADGEDPEMAKNVMAASINRAAKNRYDLGEMVGSKWYQPTIEQTQHARLGKLLKHPAFETLVQWGQRYADGQEDDPSGGATHFLAHASTMLALEAKAPQKYRSWRGWSGFDPATNDYRDVTIKDKGHSFVAPEGKFSITRKAKRIYDRITE
jgi:hypothetical protein